MASDNTVEIGFTADTSGFTDGMEEASDALEVLQAGLNAGFGGAGQVIQAATQPLQAMSAGLTQLREAFANAGAGQFAEAVQQSAAQAERDQERLNQALIDGAAKVADAQLATERALVDQKKALGQISADDAIQQLIALAGQEDAINQQRLAAMQGASADKGDQAGAARADAEQLAETQRYAQQVIRLNTQAAEATQAAWTKGFQPISQAFSSSIDGMVRGTQTLDQSVRRLAQNIVAEYANAAAQSTLKWLEAEAQKTAASQIGAQARTTADQQGQDESLFSHIAAAGKHILTDAGEVFGNVFAYLSPDIGPFAAIPAAAASAAVLAVELPSAAGGWVVPGDTMAMVHENEMILPAHLSQGLAGMIAGGQGGGGHTFNNTFNVHAGDGITARQLPDMIVKTMGKALRNGQFGGMRTL